MLYVYVLLLRWTYLIPAPFELPRLAQRDQGGSGWSRALQPVFYMFIIAALSVLAAGIWRNPVYLFNEWTLRAGNGLFTAMARFLFWFHIVLRRDVLLPHPWRCRSGLVLPHTVVLPPARVAAHPINNRPIWVTVLRA